jgi:hypothetical protein
VRELILKAVDVATWSGNDVTLQLGDDAVVRLAGAAPDEVVEVDATVLKAPVTDMGNPVLQARYPEGQMGIHQVGPTEIMEPASPSSPMFVVIGQKIRLRTTLKVSSHLDAFGPMMEPSSKHWELVQNGVVLGPLTLRQDPTDPLGRHWISKLQGDTALDFEPSARHELRHDGGRVSVIVVHANPPHGDPVFVKFLRQ